MRIISLLLILTLLCGCVSAWIDHYSGRYRGTFHPQATKTSVRADASTPSEVYVVGVNTNEPAYSYTNDPNGYQYTYSNVKYSSYDVFHMLGKVHKPGDGSTQATVNAITLGLGKIVLVPVTVAGVAADYTKRHTLVVFYDNNDKYITHRLYDSHGNMEDISGY